MRLPSTEGLRHLRRGARGRSTRTCGPTAPSTSAGTSADLITDIEANDTLRDFLERKIRSIVKDPATADLLIPKNHPPFTRRPCGEHGYYEAFNRDNVTLVDALDDPIVEITEHGVRLQSGAEHELDVLISATGFDAGTGGLTRVDIRGRDGTASRTTGPTVPRRTSA